MLFATTQLYADTLYPPGLSGILQNQPGFQTTQYSSQGITTPVNLPTFQEAVDVIVSPENPKPGEKVKITITSSSIDVKRATFTWIVNGKKTEEGIAKSSLEIEAGKAGETTGISVVLRSPTGQQATKKVSITPSDIDLTWQAGTYTPPFYEGKALYSIQSGLTAVAFPHIISGGKEVSPDSLVYEWKINGVPQASLSGYAKNSIAIPAKFLPQTITIEVKASTLDGNLAAYETISVDPIDPKILFYRKLPLQGVATEKALVGEAELADQEGTFIAIPYFFSSDTPNSSITYSWSINSAKTETPPNEKEITLRNTENNTGRSRVGLRVENMKNILQAAENSFILNYNPIEQTASF